MKRKIVSTLFALVLLLTLGLVTAVPAGAQTTGDVTIVVENQAGTPIEGAQARLFWGEGLIWKWMEPKLTDISGTATFTAAEIADFGVTNSFDPTTVKFQANASDINAVYGNVYTWAVSDELPCIAYSTTTGYTFTYNLIMFEKAAPAVAWGTETVTVTYTMGEDFTISGPVAKMGFFHGPLESHSTHPFQAYPDGEGGWDHYDMIDTNEDGVINDDDYVAATVSGTSLSASVPLRFFDDITDNIIAVPSLVKTPVSHVGLSAAELAAAGDFYGAGSSLTVGLMTINSEAVQMTLDVPAPIISISVSPLSIDFGKLYAGSTSSAQPVTVTNTSPIIAVDIEAEVFNESRPPFYEINLTLDTLSLADWEIVLDAGLSQEVSAALTVPVGTEMGTLTATLVFWAEATQ